MGGGGIVRGALVEDKVCLKIQMAPAQQYRNIEYGTIQQKM